MFGIHDGGKYGLILTYDNSSQKWQAS